MKKYLLFSIVFFMSFLGFSQNQWQNQMSDRNENFYSIERDFEIYKNQKLGESKVIPKGLGIKQFERWRYYWKNRVDVNGVFPNDGSVLNEIEQYRNSQITSKYASGTGNWTILGPTPTPTNGTTQLMVVED